LIRLQSVQIWRDLMWQNTTWLTATLRRGHASQVTCHAKMHEYMRTFMRVCPHRKSLALPMLFYSTMGNSTPISVDVHHHRLARWSKTNIHEKLLNFSWMGQIPTPNNNWWKNIGTSLPYLKDVLVSLQEVVVVSMTGMSSSSSPCYIWAVLNLKLSSKPQHNLVFPSSWKAKPMGTFQCRHRMQQTCAWSHHSNLLWK
jgi:hypothetical protein